MNISSVIGVCWMFAKAEEISADVDGSVGASVGDKGSTGADEKAPTIGIGGNDLGDYSFNR
jgi:hypothetical protein